jgi:acyl-CoA synthetase (AMP-forming)/AMP-acid ligase II
VHAVVVLRQGESATLESIQSHCRERIAGYKIPRSVEFVDALPLSSVGKVLKNELRKRHWQPPFPGGNAAGEQLWRPGAPASPGQLPVPIPQGVMKR